MKESPLFSNIQVDSMIYDETDRASYKGITIKTFFLLGLATIIGAITAFFLPTIIESGNFGLYYVTLAISSIVGVVAVIVGRMSPTLSKYFSSLYALCEGLFLGTLTAIVSEYVPGIAPISVFSTIIIFAVMLTLFGTGLLKVGTKFRRFCLAFTIGAIALLFFTTIMFLFFGDLIDYSTYLWILIGIETFLLIYGIITLGLNFAEAQFVVDTGAPKEAEWQVALGLTVSLIYIYVELVRLIALFASNRN